MLVTDPSQFNQIRKELEQSKLIAIDLETPITDRLIERSILGLAVRTDENSYYIPVGHQPNAGENVGNLQVPSDLFNNLTQPIIAHNMKFDWEVCELNGIKVPTDNLWCTMMMSVYLDENHTPGHSLDTVLQRYLGERKKVKEAELIKKFGWTQIPPAIMAIYAENDVI